MQKRKVIEAIKVTYYICRVRGPYPASIALKDLFKKEIYKPDFLSYFPETSKIHRFQFKFCIFSIKSRLSLNSDA
jgi:hypothetical protein